VVLTRLRHPVIAYLILCIAIGFAFYRVEMNRNHIVDNQARIVVTQQRIETEACAQRKETRGLLADALRELVARFPTTDPAGRLIVLGYADEITESAKGLC
jgi:hypothetical protein